MHTPRYTSAQLIAFHYQFHNSVQNQIIKITFVFVQALFSRESFVKTKPAKEHLIAGWASKVNA